MSCPNCDCSNCDCSGVVSMMLIVFGSILGLFILAWIAAGFIALCKMLLQKCWPHMEKYEKVPVKDDGDSGIEMDVVV